MINLLRTLRLELASAACLLIFRKGALMIAFLFSFLFLFVTGSILPATQTVPEFTPWW